MPRPRTCARTLVVVFETTAFLAKRYFAALACCLSALPQVRRASLAAQQ